MTQHHHEHDMTALIALWADMSFAHVVMPVSLSAVYLYRLLQLYCTYADSKNAIASIAF